MPTSTLNPIDKLAQLCSQRTVRTDRLYSTIRDFTDALETAGAKPGEFQATVDGWTLGYFNVRSNVGLRDCWSVRGPEGIYCTDLGLALNHDGYLHGDFNQPVTGPSRAILLAIGSLAGRFVEAFCERIAKSVAAMDSAIEQTESATSKLTE